MLDGESEPLVQGDGTIVRLGDSQRERAEIPLPEFFTRGSYKRLSDAVTAVVWQQADLRDVANVLFHPRGKNHADACLGGFVIGHERCAGIEDSAAREPDDVVQES